MIQQYNLTLIFYVENIQHNIIMYNGICNIFIPIIMPLASGLLRTTTSPSSSKDNCSEQGLFGGWHLNLNVLLTPKEI